MTTVIDLIRSSLLNSGAVALPQTIYADDIENGFNIVNTILTDWQLNRWLVYDLGDVALNSTGATSYTVGPSGDFVFTDQRPDKVDAVFIRKISDSTDTFLYPFSSREQYDRVVIKSSTGLTVSYYYDPTLTTNGTLYLYPVPSNLYSIHVQAKADLGQFANVTDTITLPAPYKTALLWNLAAQIRSVYALGDDPNVSARAMSSLQALINSIAQVPQAVQPVASNRAGNFSQMADPSK